MIDLKDMLSRLDLSSYEIKAYLSLLKNGKATGYELSKKSGIPSSKIYTVLSQLVEKELIIPIDTKPIRYFPRPPSEVIDNLSNQYNKVFAHLKEKLDFLYNQKGKDEIVAWNISGRKEIINRAKEMIQESEKLIFLGLWQQEYRSIRHTIKRAYSKGVRIITLTYGDVSLKVGEIYNHRPSDPLYREKQQRRFIVIKDNVKALFGSFPEERGVWTENLGLINLIRDFLIHEIYIVKIEKAIPDEIHSLFGKNWELIRLNL